MSNISELRRAAAMAAIREQIDCCELGALGAYLVALVEADWEETEPAATIHPPWRPDCNCGAAEVEDCRCEACALWREEFNGGKPAAPAAAPVDDMQRPWFCEWQDCEEPTAQGSTFCKHHHEMVKSSLEQPSASHPVVEVELVAKPAAKKICDAFCGEDNPDVCGCDYYDNFPERRKSADTPPVATNGHAPTVNEPTAEEAAREWIEARAQSAACKSETAPRINIQDLVDFTGWGRSRCIQFVAITLDALKPKSAALDRKERAAGLGALIAALAEVEGDEEDEEDEELAEAPFPASAESARGAKPVGYEGLTKPQKMYFARMRNAAQRLGEKFDEAAAIARLVG